MKKFIPLLAVAIIFFVLGYFLAREIEMDHSKNFDCPTDEDFSEFLHKFSDDPVFQSERCWYPVTYIGFDEEDENVDTFLIDKGGWQYIEIFDGINYLTQIYDNAELTTDESCDKVFSVKGVHSGIDNTFHFTVINGKWYLISTSDLSY